MNENLRLTEGNIFSELIRLALPIMGTSFVQMAYNMTDMLLMGRVGSKAVAAVGTAGFFTWLAMAFILIPKIGAEVGVAQSVGKNNHKAVKTYVQNTIQMIIVLAIVYGAFILLFRRNLISFFNLGDINVENMAVSYLSIVALGFCFYFINPIFTAIFNGYGDSRTPFIINTVGLVLNIFLDIMLILGVGIFPRLEAVGAAIGTVVAQMIVTIIFIFHARRKKILFSGFKLFNKPDTNCIKNIVKLGFPVAVQSGLFTIFSMLIARIIAKWGSTPIAVQKVGSQIEAISWMTAGGFSTALSTFVGQNYGAEKWERIYKGYFTAIFIVSIIGVLASCLLIFGAKPVFSLFIPEKEAIEQGVVYLKILGLSQLFMCIEITTGGAFNGLGKTIPPSVISIVFTGLRVPVAALISSPKILGINGVWWSISMSSVLKGIILLSMFSIFLYRNEDIGGKKLIRFLFNKSV